MHRLSEIDGVENPDTVSVLQKGLAAVDYDIAFRVSDHVGTMALQKVGFQPKSRLAAARAAHHQYVFVSGIRRILRAVAHHQPLRPGQNHIVCKHRIFKRFDVFLRSPPCRAILHAMAIFLGIFAFQVHGKPKTCSEAHANQQIHRMQTWHRIGKGCTQGRKKAEELFRHICSLGNSPRFAQIGTYKTGNEIRQVQNQQLLCLITHRSRS